MSEPEIGTEHTEAHGVSGGLEPHDHLHGHGEGQHSHEDWTPDRVQARLRRDGFCAFPVGVSFCMGRVPCREHPDWEDDLPPEQPLNLAPRVRPRHLRNEPMRDLCERMEAANRELTRMSEKATSTINQARLAHKAEGVRLALSYAREYLP